MSIRREKRHLEDVLNDYVAMEQNPSHGGLTKWIQQYPEHKKELIEFTVNWGLMEHLPQVPILKEVSEETLVLRAMSIVEDRLHTLKEQEKDSESRINDLLTTGKQLGLDVHAMAAQCKVSATIMMKLSRRFIDYSSIPQELIECIAGEIRESTQAVIDYLRRPISAEGMRFKAKTSPKLPKKQENFFDAVRKDPTLGKELQKYWLSREKKQTG
ncbi:hypothetical protein DS62_12235 [Smithella sp. SC_K08D17]|nr:hypothetical protein DS62_12235 [Smithella sp. SC_K08D17]